MAYYVGGKKQREAAKVPDKTGLERPAKTKAEAERFLRWRRAEILGGRFYGPSEERITVDDLLDAVEAKAQRKGLRSLAKIKSHGKALRSFFGLHKAVRLTTAQVERYVAERKAAGKEPATINRQLEILRQGYRLKAREIPAAKVPEIALLPVDNVRQGFFTGPEVTALLVAIPDEDVRDFVAWGSLTGQRKGAIARLTWNMLERDGEVWSLRLPGAVEKNKTARALGLSGEARAVIERRLARRRLDCPLIFHRLSKGKHGQPIKEFDALWANALEAADLPPGRLFHDLRRSAARNLIRAGVPQAVAMAVTGHKTASMFARYNITDTADTAAALSKMDAYLSLQPTERNVVTGTFRARGGGK